VVVKIFVNNTIVSIFSKDATFTPAAALAGFATIGPGLNMSTTVPGAVFKGTATDSDALDGLDSTAFMRSNTNTSTTGTLSVVNDAGLFVGLDSDGRLFVSSLDVYLSNQTQNGNLIFQVNNGGATTTAMTLTGTVANFGTTTVSVGNITNSNANGVGNIGSSSSYFNTIFAKATSAEYADLAERFEADAAYPPGTVVMLGGEKEITIAIDDLSEDVFGVVSTKAAYTMNGAAGSDDTHPPIAMTGRVPVLVTGTVRKGDRLVAAGMGLARAAKKDEITALNVIGRALENKTTTGEGTVEAVVTIN
jgi:hypothetical protein